LFSENLNLIIEPAQPTVAAYGSSAAT